MLWEGTARRVSKIAWPCLLRTVNGPGPRLSAQSAPFCHINSARELTATSRLLFDAKVTNWDYLGNTCPAQMALVFLRCCLLMSTIYLRSGVLTSPWLDADEVDPRRFKNPLSPVRIGVVKDGTYPSPAPTRSCCCGCFCCCCCCGKWVSGSGRLQTRWQ